MAFTDLGDDGVDEVIVGNGLGYEPRVRVLRQDGSEIGSFLAYAPSMGVGMNIVTCDITGDGYNEIVTAPQRGGGPHIRIFNRFGEPIDQGGFFAYSEHMREGINLACGDLTDDAHAELVTLPAAGGGAHVRVWNMRDSEIVLEQNFFAFDATDRSGLVGAVHDKKLFLAQQHTSSPVIKTLVIHNDVETVNQTTLVIDGLGVQSIVVTKNDLLLSTSSSPTIYNLTQQTTTDASISHPTLTSNGVQTFITNGRFLFTDKLDQRRIEVDISEQRLYAFEQGIMRNSFLISSGLGNATPIGEHSVLAKIPVVHYMWNYGEEDPRNYDLGWIPYNLRFYPHIYIHYAPWHNNFGHKMSHGCVNVGLENVQWVYNWAEEGTPVEVKE